MVVVTGHAVCGIEPPPARTRQENLHPGVEFPRFLGRLAQVITADVPTGQTELSTGRYGKNHEITA